MDFALKVVKWTENQMIKLQMWDIAGMSYYWSYNVSDNNTKRFVNNSCIVSGFTKHNYLFDVGAVMRKALGHWLCVLCYRKIVH